MTAVRQLNLLVSLATLLTLSACTNTGHELRDTTIPLQSQGVGTVGVGVHDQRPYILRLDRTPAFVGFALIGDQGPQDVETVTGRPLADDWNNVIARSLRARGYDAQPVVIATTDTPALAARKVKGLGTRTSILITMRDWKFVTTSSTKLYYDLTLRVVDLDGKVLAEQSEKGEENLGDGAVERNARKDGDLNADGSAKAATPGEGGLNPNSPVARMKRAQAIMPSVFQAHLERLLNDPKVVAAIR